MDQLAKNKVQPAVKKVKKKQGKGELDRPKQAEKKKRRLEKAVATSAIRTQLELKKLKKKEEQQRLDEEGATIAKAVALHVLVDEDSDDLRNLSLNGSDTYDGCEKSKYHKSGLSKAFAGANWWGLRVLKEPDLRKVIGHYPEDF